MTVAEAIKQLKKYPKDAQIYLGCFSILYRLRDIVSQRVVVGNGMDWEQITEVLLDFEEEQAQGSIGKEVSDEMC